MFERRRHARVELAGTVVERRGAGGHGRMLDLSCGGLRYQADAGPRPLRRGDPITLDLRLDGARARWVRVRGRVRRVDDTGAVAVSLGEVPAGFDDLVQIELLASLECQAVEHVLVVDPDPVTRARLAGRLRATGRHVTDVATPLDAIFHLDESGVHPRWVAIADTRPDVIASGLRAYLRGEYPALRQLRLVHAAG